MKHRETARLKPCPDVTKEMEFDLPAHVENSARPPRAFLLGLPRDTNRRTEHRARRRDRLRERTRPRRADTRTRSALRPAALLQQRLGLRNGENLRARKNGGETVMHRVLTSGGHHAGEFLIATVTRSENNPSPCKQRRNQISNSNKNGISASRRAPRMQKGKLKIAELFSLLEFPIS
jgi:hypothetical protein